MDYIDNLDKWDYSMLDDHPIRTAYNMRRCWNNEDKLKLIYLAEKHNVLWDTSYVYYRELTRRKKALDEIRQQFDDKYCVTDINSQWRNLKDVFYKKKSSYEQMVHLGESLQGPLWKFYEPLKFLLRCDDVRKSNLRKRYSGHIEMQELQELRLRSKRIIMHANARRERVLMATQQNSTSLDVFRENEEIIQEQQDFEDLSLNSFKNGQSSKLFTNNSNNRLNNNQFVPRRIKILYPQKSTNVLNKNVFLTNSQNKDEIPDNEIPMENNNDRLSPSTMTDKLLTATRNTALPSKFLTLPEKTITMKLRSTALEEGKPLQLPYNIRFGGLQEEDVQSKIIFNNSLRNKPSTSKDINPNFTIKQEIIDEDDFNKTLTSSGDNKANNIEKSLPPSDKAKILERNNVESINQISNSDFVQTTSKLSLNQDIRKFRFFGKYVEAALLDMHHQNPQLAVRLVQNVYEIVGKYQNSDNLKISY